MQKLTTILCVFLLLSSCGTARSEQNSSEDSKSEASAVVFDADSAYQYVKRQVEFGPRVPNSEAHEKTREWLVGELRRHGAVVTEQKADLKGWDGTILRSSNIIGQYNPGSEDRILLLAHYDTRPWADEDADKSKHDTPVDGANDGASGVGVLLEIARQLSKNAPSRGIDILFVDAEDYGSHDDDESWALGANYFVEHPFKEGYLPTEVILLDMVGGKDAVFPREYFSMQGGSALGNKVWGTAASLGYGDRFVNTPGGAVQDDHVPFIEAGITAIDIIELNPRGGGFNPHWHTTGDNMDIIDVATLKAVGQTVLTYILRDDE